MAYDKIITGGTVVTPDGEQTVDVAIAGEKIVAIAAGLAADPAGAEVIDASGHIVFPGVLDVHVHLELPFCGTVSADDYRKWFYLLQPKPAGHFAGRIQGRFQRADVVAK